MWDKRAQVVSVHDGDTVTVALDQGFGDTKELQLRLLGVYAPELSQHGGPETRAYVLAWLNAARTTADTRWPWIVTTARTRTDREQTTFGRYVGTITNLDASRCLYADLTTWIHDQGYAGGSGA